MREIQGYVDTLPPSRARVSCGQEGGLFDPGASVCVCVCAYVCVSCFINPLGHLPPRLTLVLFEPACLPICLSGVQIMTKKSKKAKAKAADEGDAVAAKEAGDKAQVYDSLQLAHKCILNSVRLKQ